jgi:hypothetical protein
MRPAMSRKQKALEELKAAIRAKHRAAEREEIARASLEFEFDEEPEPAFTVAHAFCNC